MSLDRNLSFLFKGSPGTGKTPAACTFAEFGPVYLAYWDKKKPVELDRYFREVIHRPELLDNIEYDVYGSSNANEYLNKMIDFASNCKYVAVITDSLTSMTGAAVNWSLGFNDKGQKITKPNATPQDMIPDWDEYKVETSMIVQAIDISQKIPAHIIWMAHPLPQIRITGGSGSRVTITTSNSLVTYGNKVAGLVPGRFTEIYHFYQELNYQTNPTSQHFKVSTSNIGDEFARTSLDLPKDFDITNKSFARVWTDLVNKKVGM